MSTHDLNPLPHFSAPPALTPAVSLADIRQGLTDSGLIVEHTFNLGLIANWSAVPAAFSECLFSENSAIAAALGHPMMGPLSDEQVVDWLNQEGKLGWLIRVEILFHPQSREIAERDEGRWFYHTQLDQALLAAIAWASTPAARPELAVG